MLIEIDLIRLCAVHQTLVRVNFFSLMAMYGLDRLLAGHCLGRTCNRLYAGVCSENALRTNAGRTP